jgi:hypothetical protein
VAGVRCLQSSGGALGFLTRLFTAAVVKAEPTVYAGDETLEVVGESFHQDVLWKLIGGRTTERVRCSIRAALVPEPRNPTDRNAVMVWIEGQCVGHLSRADAATYLPGLRRLLASGPVELAGVIVGGGPRADGMGLLGVFLDHNPKDFGIPMTGYARGGARLRTGFSEAVATDLDDESYDLSWHAELLDDDGGAVEQLRRMLATEHDPIDRHYMFCELTKRLYKLRVRSASALNDFDAACREHDSEMATIRVALVNKFGKVPVVEMYRQAVIRWQKAKDWRTMREWAERGIAIYRGDAARPEDEEDLRMRLALASAKLEMAESETRREPRSPLTETLPTLETLVCVRCGSRFERPRAPGRKPNRCPDCRAR